MSIEHPNNGHEQQAHDDIEIQKQIDMAHEYQTFFNKGFLEGYAYAIGKKPDAKMWALIWTEARDQFMSSNFPQFKKQSRKLKGGKK